MKKTILILALSAILITPLLASRWKTYTNTTHVNDFIEADNSLYLATWGGLAVFDKNPQITGADAYEIKHTYTNIDGLTNNDIRVLDFIPGKNHLWMGLYSGGVNILTPSGLKVLNLTSGLPSNKVTGIAHSDSLFYVSTNEGLAVFYQLANVSFPLLRQVYTTENGLVDNNITSMALATTGFIYMGTTHGVSYVHSDSLNYPLAWHSWKESNSSIPSDSISQVALTTGKIAVSTKKGLGVFNLNNGSMNWSIYNSQTGLESDSIYAICYAADGDLYFAYGAWHEDTMTLSNSTDITLNRLSTDGMIYAYHENTANLSSKAVTRIHDINGIIGFCSWGEGIFLEDSENWINVKTNSIGFNSVTCITNSKDKIWFGSGVQGSNKTRKGTRGVSSFDGNTWQSYAMSNSPLISDNVMTIAVDDQERIWMGAFYAPSGNIYGWKRGLNIFDPKTDTWDWLEGGGLFHYNETLEDYSWVTGTTTLLSNAVTHVFHDSQNRMLVSCYNGGVLVLDSLFQRISALQIPSSSAQSVIMTAESEDAYFFGTANDFGLSYWTDKENILTPSEIVWHTPPASELNNCWVYGVVSFINDFGENEVWIAASNGVYSYNGTNWYKYDVDVKRRIYRNGAWTPDVNGYYYYDEERLFGSVHTTPTSIFLDPFRRLWIGSADYGFSMYDPSTERFTNYNTSNSPLISDFIVSLGYDGQTGSLFIGTPEGLCSFQIGYEQAPQSKIKSVRVYPNPFRPDLGQALTLENKNSTGTFPQGKNICRIYDASGDFIIELEQNLFYSFTWDGRNGKGRNCSSGIYHFVITTASGDSRHGKIALIRG